MKVDGKLNFNLNFELDMARPDSLKFDCYLDSRKFHIVSYGANRLDKMNESFEYTAYEDGVEKIALVNAIANHMKKSYLNWNRESVNDELIEKHLNVLSKDKLKLNQDFRFEIGRAHV